MQYFAVFCRAQRDFLPKYRSSLDINCRAHLRRSRLSASRPFLYIVARMRRTFIFRFSRHALYVHIPLFADRKSVVDVYPPHTPMPTRIYGVVYGSPFARNVKGGVGGQQRDSFARRGQKIARIHREHVHAHPPRPPPPRNPRGTCRRCRHPPPPCAR